MLTFATIAPIIWAKWGGTTLEVLRQEALEAADGLAFRALNSQAGRRTILVVCTVDRRRTETVAADLSLRAETRSVDWANYSVAEMVFKTERGNGFSYREQDAQEPPARVLCATRPAGVQTLERTFDLPE